MADDHAADEPAPLPLRGRPSTVSVDSQSDVEEEPREVPNPAAKSETRLQKLLTRLVFGSIMTLMLIGVMKAGALCVAITVMLFQAELFRELVNVRYKRAKEKEMPLFRTLQWTWFFVAMFFTYGDFAHTFCMEHQRLQWLTPFTQYHSYVTFGMYSALFVASVITLKPGLVRFQLTQLMWTVVTLCLIVGQCKFIAYNIFEGLFWILFPMSVVIMNDVGAYFCGMSMGKRFIKAPFFQLSPNKTWEGFLGSAVCTMVFAFFFSAHLAGYKNLVCPTENVTLLPVVMECVPNRVFLPAEYTVPMWLASFGLPATVTLLPIQLHGLVYGLFASSVAPFGGLMASAIKRAYGIKDFDSLIPGHGGVMDRMDCQLIMLLFAYVHYNTFVRSQAANISRLLAAAALLSPEDQQVLHRLLGEQLARTTAAAIGVGAAPVGVVEDAGGGTGAGGPEEL